MKICITVPKRFAAVEELPRAFFSGPDAQLFVLPEGFLRSQEELNLALKLTKELPATVVAGYREGHFEKALTIERGRVVDEYTKCILTSGEKAKGKQAGDEIRCLNSRFGKIAAPVCYELHFPEVCRMMALENPVLMVNPIGTGMYHDLQYGQWRALARARAIENEVPVVGCCHFCGPIPLAFAFGAGGEPLLDVRERGGSFMAEVEITGDKPIGYMKDRRPQLFAGLSANPH